MSSTPDHSRHMSVDENPAPLAARLVAIAMVVGGLVALYYRWRFTAAYSPSSDGNILGLGWAIEAAFWCLRSIPTVVWASLLTLAGALALHGMALPKKRRG
jgi:hypothetical protein